MPNDFTAIQSAANMRNERIGVVNATRGVVAVQSRLDSSAAPAESESGYWNGNNYETYFTLGKSLLGGSDGLK